ncbi:ribosome biogenesis factor YjgA [Pseudoalteromonas fenneropenaei]|uniref:Dual-action ribosomal maturation protein DarP n=1 Tax=Pseudoalteromonas fenneropenaei TaxID=1737459 RepID=A0ABV7CK20_9GAMM
MANNQPPHDDEEIIYVSKSELKRDAQELHQLGLDLVALGKKQRERLPLSPVLQEAMAMADKLQGKHEAYRRHLNYISKTLRTTENVAEIQAALDVLMNKNNQADVLINKIEQIRTALLKNGDDKANELLEQYPALERQKLRQLIRAASKEVQAEKPAKSYKELFQYLKEAILP